MNICQRCGLVGEWAMGGAGALELVTDLSFPSYRVAKRRLDHVRLVYRSEPAGGRWGDARRRLFVDFDKSGEVWAGLVNKVAPRVPGRIS